jgi:hypothetical protein
LATVRCRGLSKVWFGMVPYVQTRNVEGMERYLMYRWGMWMVWYGARCVDGVLW